jgi:sugar/nucleoside kinase (ribokinase family)
MPGNSVKIVGFGAGAHDYFRPVGEVGDNHRPGAKVGWTDREDDLLRKLIDSDCETHVGGNAMNVLAYLALRGAGRPEVGFASALGHDRASNAIRNSLDTLGIRPLTTTHEDYLPSVSIIERLRGSDRMVRGRPRTPLNPHISDLQIKRATTDANLVVAASLKSITLADRVFTLTPEDTFIAYNPGSSEFADPDGLLEIMTARKPGLLALNDEELYQLTGAEADADPVEVVAEANRYANYVLCTLGAKGILLAHNHRVIHHPAVALSPDEVVDTLGAGDRANAITIDSLRMRRSGQEIVRRVAHGTAALIQHTGAHGDLYNANTQN